MGISLHLFCPYYIYPCTHSLLIIYIPAFILSILHIFLHIFSPYYIYPCIYSVHITYIPESILSLLYVLYKVKGCLYIYCCLSASVGVREHLQKSYKKLSNE